MKQKKARAGQRKARALGEVQLFDHGAVVPPRDGDELVSASVGPGGELVSLWAGAESMTALRSVTTQPGFATFPDPGTGRPVPARVVVQGPYSPDVVAVTELSGVEVAHPDVQPLPDGHLLLVGARCRWSPAGPDRNAVVYDPAGQVVARGTLGDGVQHVQTTSTGQIWVGYFDEGVFGNYGWAGPGPEPIGAPGLVRFRRDLNPEWSFPSDEVTAERICDCYALNVTDREVWTCYYTDFPLVRVRDGVVTTWHTTLKGPGALAVERTTAAFVGGYGPERDTVVLAELADDHVRVTHRGQLRLTDGRRLPDGAVVHGRGSVLHVIAGRRWYQITVEQLTALIR